MSQAKGYASVLQIVAEVTFGTDPGSGYAGLAIVSHTLKGVQDQEVPEVVTGLRSEYEPQPGVQSVQGNVVVPIDPTHFATWLGYMFDAGTGLLLPTQGSFTLVDAAVGTKLLKYSGCKIASLGLVLSRKRLRATIGIAGCSVAAAATATPSAVTIAPFLAHQMSFTEGGSALDGATELAIDVDFGITPDDFIIAGPAYRKALDEGSVRVSGRLTRLFDSDAQLTKSLANTETSLGVAVNNGSKTLTISLPEVMFEFPTTDVQGPQGRMMVLPFKAFVGDDADESAIQMSIADNP
jgi:hypothetical protein